MLVRTASTYRLSLIGLMIVKGEVKCKTIRRQFCNSAGFGAKLSRIAMDICVYSIFFATPKRGHVFVNLKSPGRRFWHIVEAKSFVFSFGYNYHINSLLAILAWRAPANA